VDPLEFHWMKVQCNPTS